jgi:hypothetical protein
MLFQIGARVAGPQPAFEHGDGRVEPHDAEVAADRVPDRRDLDVAAHVAGEDRVGYASGGEVRPDGAEIRDEHVVHAHVRGFARSHPAEPVEIDQRVRVAAVAKEAAELQEDGRLARSDGAGQEQRPRRGRAQRAPAARLAGR